MDDITTYVVILIALLIIGHWVISLMITLFSNKKKKEVLKKLLNCLTGSLSKFSFTPIFKGEYQGLRFSVILAPARWPFPPYLKISIPKRYSLKLNVYSKNSHFSAYRESLGNFSESFCIPRKVITNDEIFDREFLIFSNKPAQVVSYLNNVTIKNTIKELFDNGFDTFWIDGRQVFIEKPNYILEKDLEPQNIIMLLQKLSLLASGFVSVVLVCCV